MCVCIISIPFFPSAILMSFIFSENIETSMKFHFQCICLSPVCNLPCANADSCKLERRSNEYVEEILSLVESLIFAKKQNVRMTPECESPFKKIFYPIFGSKFIQVG